MEAEVTYVRMAELAEHPLPGAYDLTHLQAFHRRIFGDVYDWAGEIRTITIARGDLFALPQHIESYLSDVLAQLPRKQHLQGLAREPLIDRLTHYLAEINATHPFREGNGRTQRAFIGQLAPPRRAPDRLGASRPRSEHRGLPPLAGVRAAIESRFAHKARSGFGCEVDRV